MAIGAHPDDCEFGCGGTASLWAERGQQVVFLSVTNGQSGHHLLGCAELVRRRAAEAAAAAQVIGARSQVLPVPDGHLEPTLQNRLMLIRAIRQYDPDLLITHRPCDYHPDHRYTSLLVQDAIFSLTVPHIAPEVPAMQRIPAVLYWWDGLRKPAAFQPDLVIDIDPVFDRKIAMLHQHESQVYEWLPWLEGKSQDVPSDAGLRLEFLRRWYESAMRPPIAERYRDLLVERYGGARGAKVRQAEAFEVCEYGAPLDESCRNRLFGGL